MIEVTLFLQFEKKKKKDFTMESFDSASLQSGDCFPKLKKCHLRRGVTVSPRKSLLVGSVQTIYLG